MVSLLERVRAPPGPARRDGSPPRQPAPRRRASARGQTRSVESRGFEAGECVCDPCVTCDCVFCSFSGHHWTFWPDRSPGPSRLAGVYLGGVGGPVPFWGEQEAGEPGPWASAWQDEDRMARSPGLGPPPSGRGAHGGLARPLRARDPSDRSREGGSLGPGFRQGRRAFQETWRGTTDTLGRARKLSPSA